MINREPNIRADEKQPDRIAAADRDLVSARVEGRVVRNRDGVGQGDRTIARKSDRAAAGHGSSQAGLRAIHHDTRTSPDLRPKENQPESQKQAK
jgi:hypothetical protein